MSALDTQLSTDAPVMEVFASIQGEGLYVGEPQVLLRLRGCPLRCRWCDTPASWHVKDSDRARVAAVDRSHPPRSRSLGSTSPGSTSPGSTRREGSWVTPFQAACWIAEVEPGAPRTVSVTGGEPLMWPDFLLGLRAMVGSRRLHLETAGAHPRTLERVLHAFDHVSLDLKPDLDLDPPEEIGAHSREHSTPTSERSPRTREEWHAARLACLALVRDRDACGKVVVSGEREPEDFVPLFDEVERMSPELPLFLQPATPVHGVRAPSSETLVQVCEMARDRDLRVRVLPQVHKYLGLA